MFNLILYPNWHSPTLPVSVKVIADYYIPSTNVISRWYVEKEIFMVFYEAAGKKELKWELSSDIGKYDNMYKLSFKTINDQGAENGTYPKRTAQRKLTNQYLKKINYTY